MMSPDIAEARPAEGSGLVVFWSWKRADGVGVPLHGVARQLSGWTRRGAPLLDERTAVGPRAINAVGPRHR